MEWVSTLRHAHIAPRKARLVADLIRGRSVDDALARLQFTPKKAAGIIKKVLESALSNASRSAGVDEDRLYISSITIDEGPTAKRWRPRAMGRATRIRKRTSHIHIALEED
ncbi:MAG: 50S ribosomal protein L22 [Desulfomonilaceae bacterium]|nr:50S ribosomal protein L22 [Desulfomonilaceae bacterium]